MAEPYVKIQDISMHYPVKGSGNIFKGEKRKVVKAVNNVSLTLERGEVLGLIGESGCGKSTLGRVLTRLEKPTGGEIYFDGEAASAMVRENTKKFYETVQIIFQNPFETFTPRDTIGKIFLRPLKNHGIGADNEERTRLVVEALEKGGLRPARDIMARYPHELSGGQLQRISILRSMLLKPKVIVADEPVSMLDVSVRADIINMLLALSAEQNASVVFISHDIALTRHISDNVAVMYLGRIVEYGQSDEVIKNPRHPYTQVLISNCASISPEDQEEPIKIEGEPPTPINPGPGCFFANRCFMASDRCIQEYPEMRQIGGSHSASCWNM